MLLGSRLQSNEHVFAFILLAIEIFAFFPIFQREVKVRTTYASVAFCVCVCSASHTTCLFCSCVCLLAHVQRNSERAHLVTAVVLFLLSMCLTWPISRLLSVVSALFIVFLSFVCPLWFMHVQEYKKYVLVRKPCLLALLLRVCVCVYVCVWI